MYPTTCQRGPRPPFHAEKAVLGHSGRPKREVPALGQIVVWEGGGGVRIDFSPKVTPGWRAIHLTVPLEEKRRLYGEVISGGHDFTGVKGMKGSFSKAVLLTVTLQVSKNQAGGGWRQNRLN